MVLTAHPQPSPTRAKIYLRTHPGATSCGGVSPDHRRSSSSTSRRRGPSAGVSSPPASPTNMEAIVDEADPVDPRFNDPFSSATPSLQPPPAPRRRRKSVGSRSPPAMPPFRRARRPAAASTRREVRRDLSHRPRSTTSTLATTVPSPATTCKARTPRVDPSRVRSGLGDGTTVRERVPLRTRHGVIEGGG